MFFTGNQSDRAVRIIHLMQQLNTRMQLRHTGMAITVFYFRSVKIIRKENSNFDLALQKRRFCVAKEPLLPCKTYAFGMQNNRFCNALIIRWLCDSWVCEKYLRFYCVVSSHRRRFWRGARKGEKFFSCLERLALYGCFHASFVGFLSAVNEYKKANQRSLQALVRFYFV